MNWRASVRMSRIVVLACLAGVMASTGGCIIVSEKTRCMDMGISSPLVTCSSSVRYTPYAAALDRVLRQEAVVSRELGACDWSDIRNELGNWQRYVRRLAGAANTTGDPAALRGHCAVLGEHIEVMRQAARHRDIKVIEEELDAVAPTLSRLSTDFTLTEPVTTVEPAADGESADV